MDAAKLYKTAEGQKGKATGTTVAASKRPMTDATKKATTRRLRWLVEQKNTRLSSVIMGIIVTIVMLGIAAAMFALAGIFENTDFYIVGGLFCAGGTIFLVIFIVNNCSPWVKDRRIHAQLDRQLEELEGQTEAPTVLSPSDKMEFRY